ncbi:MAG: Txe/YoeB family addiction module toxin [Treponema sp.]|nr:Txe/YoeB family addiction module toxin [Treponema sp.]
MYKVILSRKALKDLEKLKQAGLSKNARAIAAIVSINPFQNPPQYEKLSGDLQDYYSRRITIQHRFVYRVLPNIDNALDDDNNPYNGIVHVLRMWTHYE